jgi:signal transduction histidine kinase
VQGIRQGTIAVSAPTAKAFASVRGAGVRLALVLLAGLVGIVAIGIVLTRFILSQVRPLVATNRALGSGDLSARAPVLGRDELGELALGVNQMAEQLEANVETLESRVQQRTEEVRRLLRERTEFFAALSHEFRTPLAVILRQADLLLDPRTKKTPRWASQSGSMLKDSGQQLLVLINDILDLAKAEAGGLEMNLEKVRLAEAVNDLKRTISGLAKGSGLSVSIKIPADLPAVRADRGRLREIILNLVDNAVKYTPAGGRVELSAAARNGDVIVSVSDTGVGIPPEARENMFEPFYRVKGISAQRGQASSGLGLALTRRLVEAQGGEINYESEAGEGSTFTFTLTPV